MTTLWLLLFVLLAHAQTQDLPPKLEAFIKRQEDVVREVAEKAAELHANRVELVRKCQCTRHACADDFEGAKCVHHLGTPKLCEGIGEAEGRMTDYERSIFRTPPGTDPEHLSDELKESICVYKDIEEVAKTYGEMEFGWIYVGTVDGHFRRWPGTPRQRNREDGDPLLRGCKIYDPRIRPWFIAASSGPKDIVLVVDKSQSMHDIVDQQQRTKWDLTKEAIKEILDTFTFTDFVNVVTFSDSASPLWTESALTRGRANNLNFLKDAIDAEVAEGATNFTAAFSTAFSLLTDACGDKDKSCSNCQKIILFLTDGKDTSSPTGTSIRPSKIASLINDLQDRLVESTRERASIFTFSMSERADDSIPRQVACANDGAWSFIGPTTDTLDALNSYYRYVAAGRRTDYPIWVQPYEDSSGLGLGNVTGVALPFYAKRKVDGLDVFLGVAGHRVGLHEFEEAAGITEEEALDLLIDRSERCSFSQQTDCLLQVYRHVHDERSLCPDPHRTRSSELPEILGARSETELALCYPYDNNFYKRIEEELSPARAAARYEEDGGQLVSIGDAEELAFVANLASADGSWTSGERVSQDEFSWMDGTPNLTVRSPFWGLGEPTANAGVDICVAMDSRGITGNLYAVSCTEELTFICKYSSNSSCTEMANVPKKGFFKVPPLDSCRQSEEVLHVTRPIEDVKDLTSENVMCPLGNGQVTTADLVCCSSNAGSVGSAPVQIWVIVFVSFLLSVVFY